VGKPAASSAAASEEVALPPEAEPDERPPFRSPLNLAFKYWGKYGGPRYTGGRIDGKDFSVKPEDELDELFRQHDYLYRKISISEADGFSAGRLASHVFSRDPRVGVYERGAALLPAVYFGVIGDRRPRLTYLFPWQRAEPEPPPYDLAEEFTPL